MGNNPERYTPNPYNVEPRIRLVGKDGILLEMISQIEAFHLLRQGFCTLQLVKPPTVQFELEEWDHRFKTAKQKKFSSKPPKWLKKHKSYNHWLSSRQTILYGNVHVQHPDGHVMFHCDVQKALWYLNRDLVEVISSDPPILRLNFEPGGAGYVGDKYYLTPKVNQCVCCGKKYRLNRHHVVPYVFRRYMSKTIKDHNYHDVLLLCLPCHEKYERQASNLKREICSELGLSVDGSGGPAYNPVVGGLRGASRALLKHGDQIPEERKKELLGFIQKHAPESADDLEYLSELNPWAVCDDQATHYGQLVVKHIEENDQMQAFTERWRLHFVECMAPKYLPEYWDVSKPLVRDSQ